MKTMSLALADGVSVSTANVLAGRKTIRAGLKVADQRATITFADEIHLAPEMDLHITLA